MPVNGIFSDLFNVDVSSLLPEGQIFLPAVFDIDKLVIPMKHPGEV
jgi:hypothetical protein